MRAVSRFSEEVLGRLRGAVHKRESAAHHSMLSQCALELCMKRLNLCTPTSRNTTHRQTQPKHKQTRQHGAHHTRPLMREPSSGRQRNPPEYTTKRLPRREPTGVSPSSRASFTARLLGAETDATMGIPAASAFCTISNPPRPLTIITCRLKGNRPSINAHPMILS